MSQSRELSLKPLLGCGVVMFWQAVRRTLGKAMTFETRLENLPCEYWVRTKAWRAEFKWLYSSEMNKH